MTADEPATRPVDVESPLADPARRLLARVIDAAIPASPLLLLVPLGVALGSAALVRAGVWGLFVVSAIVLAIDAWWLYRYGQTVGKRLARIRIVQGDGRRAGFWRIVGRRVLLPWAIGVIPFVGILFAVANPLFIFTRYRRCLHDHLASTIVIDLRAGHGEPKTF